MFVEGMRYTWPSKAKIAGIFGAFLLVLGYYLIRLIGGYGMHLANEFRKALFGEGTPRKEEALVTRAWAATLTWKDNRWPSRVNKRHWLRRARRIRPPRPKKVRNVRYLPNWVWWLLWILLAADFITSCVLTAILGHGDFTRFMEIVALSVAPVILALIGGWIYESVPWSAIGRRLQRWFDEWKGYWPALLVIALVAAFALLTPQTAISPPMPPANQAAGHNGGTSSKLPARKAEALPKEVILWAYGDFHPNAQVVVTARVTLAGGELRSETFTLGTTGRPKVNGFIRLHMVQVGRAAKWRITYRTQQGYGSFVIGRGGSFGNPYFQNEAYPHKTLACGTLESSQEFVPGLGVSRTIFVPLVVGDVTVLHGEYQLPGPKVSVFGGLGVPVSVKFRAYFANGRWWAEPIGREAEANGQILSLGFTPGGPYKEGDISRNC